MCLFGSNAGRRLSPGRCGSVVRHPSANAGSISGSGRLAGGGNGNILHYFCLENPMDRRAWWVTVHGVAKSQTWLSINTVKGDETKFGYLDPRKQRVEECSSAGEGCRPSVLAKWLPWRKSKPPPNCLTESNFTTSSQAPRKLGWVPSHLVCAFQRDGSQVLEKDIHGL